MHLRWTRSQPRHARIEFVDESETYVERSQLEQEFRTIVDAVLERIRGFGRHEHAVESLADAWEAVNTLDSDEQEFSRAAALLGIDPYEVSDDIASDLIEFWETVDSSIREDALASTSEESLRSIGQWLHDALDTLADAESGSDWQRVRQVVSVKATGAPWTRGYDLARCARSELSVGEGRFEFDGDGALALRHVEQEMPSPRIHGLVAPRTPSCVTAPRIEPGRRFLLARALGDYLDRSEPNAGILTSLATDRQAQNRAFAAEFLAPAEALRAALDNANPVEPEQVDELVVVQPDRNGCYSGSRGITFTLGGDGSEILRDPPQGGRTGRIDPVGKDRTGGGLPPAECADPAVGRPGRTRTWTTRHGDRGAGGGHSTDGREGA